MPSLISMMGTVQRPRSPRSNRDKFILSPPQMSPTRNLVDYEPPRRSAMVLRGTRDMREFSTPQRVTVMGREREFVEFRTPRHPISGTNNWGGASPLLSKNIPRESLQTSYLRFNAVSVLGHDDNDKTTFPARANSRSRMRHATPARHEMKDGGEARRGGILSMLRWWRKKEEKVLWGDKKKGSWLPDGGHRRRWPQGW